REQCESLAGGQVGFVGVLEESMRLRTLTILAFSLLAGHAWASQPGQPLDCSDWVFSEPGHTCTVFAAVGNFPLDQQYDGETTNFLDKGNNLQVDNAGHLFALRLFTGDGNRSEEHTSEL